ncbi:tetraacyldisaccharide 4'-kinase [Prevotella bivia DNF00650]|uniref:tetraacyldisaccharide 4'-kinase n=1 Tax=Prevotella bivia TaxID=28125 RepID=UPI00050F5F8A|nr:tetraacyldisaccharide 4'-kinase [Prevotella bivia]KGF35130.1 tetraacyldisaccharide 4'-kinase [Prevotella bivia DNF00650]WIL17500.1 tetraacyldisaccharide 4'-kinase [Prevotella bivia]
MEGDYIKINRWLLPFSWLYGLGVGIRNYLFDAEILKSKSYSIPVISVGNITVGGAGKTPHVEYLIDLLRDEMQVAVLSRGYKRKSRGYVVADENTTMRDIGDEPFQIKQKFEGVYVAVDKDRCHGIDHLISDEDTKDVEVILLDDAFQHRYVKPGVNILLVDYHKFINYDKLLPAGRLREPQSAKVRADIVIVTKCPKNLNPIDYRVLSKAMDLKAFQQLYFTTLSYCDLKPIFNGGDTVPLNEIMGENILLLTGIASPEHLQVDIMEYTRGVKLETMAFSDHHNFTERDVERINERFAAMPSPKRIITTEKDQVRLFYLEGLSEEVKQNIYALPIKVEFMLEGGKIFNEKIESYVRKNSRNSILAKRKNVNKPRNSNRSGNRPRTISFRDNR